MNARTFLDRVLRRRRGPYGIGQLNPDVFRHSGGLIHAKGFDASVSEAWLRLARGPMTVLPPSPYGPGPTIVVPSLDGLLRADDSVPTAQPRPTHVFGIRVAVDETLPPDMFRLVGWPVNGPAAHRAAAALEEVARRIRRDEAGRDAVRTVRTGLADVIAWLRAAGRDV